MSRETMIHRTMDKIRRIREWWPSRRQYVQDMTQAGLWVDSWVVETPAFHRGALRPHRFLIEVYPRRQTHPDVARENPLPFLTYLTEAGEDLVARIFEEEVDTEGRNHWKEAPLEMYHLQGFIVHLLFSGAAPLTVRRHHPPHQGWQSKKIYEHLNKRFEGDE